MLIEFGLKKYRRKKKFVIGKIEQTTKNIVVWCDFYLILKHKWARKRERNHEYDLKKYIKDAIYVKINKLMQTLLWWAFSIRYLFTSFFFVPSSLFEKRLFGA